MKQYFFWPFPNLKFLLNPSPNDVLPSSSMPHQNYKTWKKFQLKSVFFGTRFDFAELDLSTQSDQKCTWASMQRSADVKNEKNLTKNWESLHSSCHVTNLKGWNNYKQTKKTIKFLNVHNWVLHTSLLL